jgi:hypothetical protein
MMIKEMTKHTLKGLVKTKGTRFYDKVYVKGGYIVNKMSKKKVTEFLKEFEDFAWIEVEVKGHRIFFPRHD